MGTPTTRNILIVFIASPGDLLDERKAAHEVVQELNSTFRTIDWEIDLLGYEDTMPGVARPQELINKDVDACHLFVGALWKRWGQPTGTHSSGFEEEFERAIKRRTETNEPEIWLFFKRIDTDLLQDQGPQLTRVLDFKQSEIELKRVLFKDFDAIEEWKNGLRRWLTQFILARYKELQQPPEKAVTRTSRTEPARQDNAISSEPQTEPGERPSREQLRSLIASIGNVVNASTSTASLLGTDDLDSFEIIRNYLLSTTLMLSLTTTSLGVHETHLLYLNRTQLEADPKELMMLFRTVLGDDNDLIPGWYWLSWMNSDELVKALLKRASSDGDFNVRLHAWELLKRCGTSVADDPAWREYIVKVSTLEESAPIRRAAVEYLGSIATETDIKTIEALMTDDRDGLVRRQASVSRLVALARLNPITVLEEGLPDLESEKKQIISELYAHAKEIRSDALCKATHNADEKVRLFALKELRERNELSIDLALSLNKDPSSKVCDYIYRCLIERGQQVDPSDVLINVSDETSNMQFDRDSAISDPPFADPRGIILEIYKEFSQDDLWALADWESDFGDIAYKALGIYYFSEVGDRFRSDLTDDFKDAEQSFFQFSLAKWKDFYSDPSNAFLISSRGLFSSFWGRKQKEEENTPETSAKKEAQSTKNKFLAAALAAIVANGHPSDIIFGRRYASSEDYEVRLAAVRVISRFGSENDVASLIEVAKSSEGILQETAALAALKRSGDILDAARNMIFSAKESLVRIVMKYLLTGNDVRTTLLLEPLLVEKSDVLRKKSVAFFAKTLSAADLEKLLTKYTSNVTYYYDVVCWLDRVLYAPAELKSFFAGQLESELE